MYKALIHPRLLVSSDEYKKQRVLQLILRMKTVTITGFAFNVTSINYFSIGFVGIHLRSVVHGRYNGAARLKWLELNLN